MQSPLKKIIVFDLETGGFNYKFNPITEFAGVVLENDTLEIIEEKSVLIKPYLDLSHIEINAKTEAKALFESLKKKDEDTKIQTLKYNNQNITLKTISSLVEDIEQIFLPFLEKRVLLKGDSGYIFTYEEYLQELDKEHGKVIELYFSRAYNPQALEITGLSIEMLLKNGLKKEEAFKQIKNLFRKHVVGNSRPVIAGHKIITFDKDFMVKLFKDFKQDFNKEINEVKIDTLQWSHLKWFEMANFQLGTCANEVGLTLKEAHRALADTVANAKFLIKMLKSLRGEGDQKSKYRRRKYKLNY